MSARFRPASYLELSSLAGTRFRRRRLSSGAEPRETTFANMDLLSAFFGLWRCVPTHSRVDDSRHPLPLPNLVATHRRVPSRILQRGGVGVHRFPNHSSCLVLQCVEPVWGIGGDSPRHKWNAFCSDNLAQILCQGYGGPTRSSLWRQFQRWPPCEARARYDADSVKVRVSTVDVGPFASIGSESANLGDLGIEKKGPS